MGKQKETYLKRSCAAVALHLELLEKKRAHVGLKKDRNPLKRPQQTLANINLKLFSCKKAAVKKNKKTH